MNNYTIKCFVVYPSEYLRKIIIWLIKDYKFIVDRGWENGYHLLLRGTLDDESLHVVIRELEKGISDSMTSFDEAEFIRKYETTAKLLQKTNVFKPIFKGNVTVDIEESIFEKEIEDELFRETNHIFDLYYCKNYFRNISLYQIIEEAMKFHNALEVYEKFESTDAYNCHLSHYIAFIHRLNQASKKSIEKKFKMKYEEDLNEGLFNFELSPTPLTKNLMSLFHRIRILVKRKQLDFYMPFNRKRIDEKIDSSSKRHQETFSKDNMNYHLYNEVLIMNRWMINALYKKLLLLGLSNIDRFYMNYVISRLIYSEKELNDY